MFKIVQENTTALPYVRPEIILTSKPHYAVKSKEAYNCDLHGVQK